MTASFSPSLNLNSLQRMVRTVEASALLIEPRILRRIIRLDQRLPGLGPNVPHHQSYVIERDRMLAYVDQSELELRPGIELPRIVVLLSKPDEDELQAPETAEKVVRDCARDLFHACVHKELELRWESIAHHEALSAERARQIGSTEFAEIRSVLLKDHLLFSTSNELDVYCEFAAVYLELRYFSPSELPVFFPSIRDWTEIDRIVSQDIDHWRLYQRLRYESLTASVRRTEDTESSDETVWRPPVVTPVTLLEFRKLQARAERASLVGNGIKAAIWHTRSARVAPESHASEAHISASGELTRFAQRLQQALQLTDHETAIWRTALQPLLLPASVGFWASEARLLYDLQKVCVEQERGVYRLDLIEWVRTLGQRPLRRPLPLLRDASMIRYLRIASRRVATARIRREERERLTDLLTKIVERVERHSRDRLRPLIVETLDEVGFVPQNVPESVGRQKLVEELLDRVVERSWLSMGDLRDAVSKNDLKLPDVSSPRELVRGDRLLKADRKLDVALDGVYRRGAIYQRVPQMLSSLAFGTPFGRFVTQYMVVPFGGAYLAAAFVRHLALGQLGHSSAEAADATLANTTAEVQASNPSWLFYAWVVLLGCWVSLILHRPSFRAWNYALLSKVGRGLRLVFVDFPTRIIRSEFVIRIRNSYPYLLVRRFLLAPALLTGLIWLGIRLSGNKTGNRLLLEIFLITALALNSSLGRYATEVTSDLIMRAWRELTIRVFAAVLQAIMDAFESIFSALEQVIYTVDEWLRFRTGDKRLAQAVKLMGGVVWFFVSYVVMFVFTLLVEPQINPIKHFPVVTVAHKLILPTGPMFVSYLTPYIGKAEANTLVWTTIWLVPGVFGFLVWELKENWRLYGANRPRRLKPVSIGRHGETMTQLLRAGIHSGTLPKAFAALRTAIRKTELGAATRGIARRKSELNHVAEAVRRFVERDLFSLLRDAEFLPEARLQVGKIRLATNRIDVELLLNNDADSAALLSWEEIQGNLRGMISRAGWLESLSDQRRKQFISALTGLFQRAGIESSAGGLPEYRTSSQPVEWDRWVATWSEQEDKPAMESSMVEVPRDQVSL